jgi:hypothetical protein
MSYMHYQNTSLTRTVSSSVYWGNAGVTSHYNCFWNATNVANYASIPNDWKGL